MKRLIRTGLIFLVAVPLCLWLIVMGFGAIQPERMSTQNTDGKTVNLPRDEPREGYEIIYPYIFNGGPDHSRFYYVSTKRQVIYRYDAQRYLELQGENCEGLIWYHDEGNNIHTRIDETFYTADKLPKFKYMNPGRDYIAIPTQDLTAVMFSLDGGKQFIKGTVTSDAAVSGEKIDRFIGMDDRPLTVYHSALKESNPFESYQKPLSISGNTGYFILKNGDVIFGATVFYDKSKEPKQGFHILRHSISDKSIKYWGGYSEIYRNPAYIERIEAAKNIQVEPYQGWDHIRCEVGAEK